MIWALIGIVVIAEAAKLDNAYLPPPPSAKESGGSDGALQLPLEPPYIDQYTPAEDKPEVWRPGTRSLKKGSKGSTPDDKFLENEDEISVPALEKGRFISGSYSYTGPDNVLVTVTYKADSRKGRKEDEDAKVTDDNVAEDDDDEAEEEEEAEEDVVRDAQEEDEELIVPTPPSLPAELARAFDFHKNKNFAQEEKATRTKKPIRKNHKNKVNKHGGNYYGNQNQISNNYEGQYGQKIPGHIHGHKQGSHAIAGPAYQYPVPNYEGQPGQKIPAHHGHKQGSQGFAEPSYQYPPPNQYGPPSINQGYSYPKAS